MDVDNLGKVFGPTILRTPKPDSKEKDPLHGRPSDLANRFVSANIVGNVAASLIKNYSILEEETVVEPHYGYFNGITSTPNFSPTFVHEGNSLSASATNIATGDLEGKSVVIQGAQTDARMRSKSSIFGMFGRGRSKSVIKPQIQGFFFYS